MSNELHRVYETVNTWRTRSCGCVANDHGFVITYCGKDNPKRGTHWGSK